MAKHLLHRLPHGEIEHADAAVLRQGERRDVRRLVVEGLAEHVHARMPGADAVGEGLPERQRLVADGVDPQRIHALPDPVQVGIDQVVHHRWIVGIEVRQLGQVGLGVVERVQRVVRRIELVRRQVLVIGHQPAFGVEQLPELRLGHRHGPGRRPVVADDVQHGLQAMGAQAGGEAGEIQPCTGQVLVQAVKVHPPVAVVAGLAAVGQEAGAGDRITPGEGLVGVVHDRREPHRGEAQVVDVGGIVEQAAEVAAQVADVAGLAVARRQRQVEGGVGAALLALVVGRIAIDEAVGEHEVDRLGSERLQRTVDLGRCGYRRRCRRIGRLARTGRQQQGRRQHG